MNCYYLIGELHLGKILEVASFSDYLGKETKELARACDCVKKELTFIQKLRPKYLFLEGYDGMEGCHITPGVEELYKAAARKVKSKLIYLDRYESNDSENAVYQRKREKRWAEKVTKYNSGLIIVGDAHSKNLKSLLKEKGHKVKILYTPKLLKSRLEKKDWLLIKQVYDKVKHKRRAEIEGLERILQEHLF